MKLFNITIILLFSLLLSSSVEAQISIEGTQVKKAQNIQYEGQAVYVPQKSKIVSVEGSLTSFSLRIDNFARYQFYYSDNQYEPPTYSVVIEPGMYQLFPDLPPGIDSVHIKIKIEPIK